MSLTTFDIYLFDLVHELRNPKPYDDFIAYHRDTQAMTVRFLRENTSMTYPAIFELFGVNGYHHRYRQEVKRINEKTYIDFSQKLKTLLCTDLD